MEKENLLWLKKTEDGKAVNIVELSPENVPSCSELKPLIEKDYSGFYTAGTSDNKDQTWYYVLNFIPVDMYKQWHIKMKVTMQVPYNSAASVTQQMAYTGMIDLYGAGFNNSYSTYKIWNSHSNTSYRTFYYYRLSRCASATNTAKYGYLLGFNFVSSYAANNKAYARDIHIELLAAENCTTTVFDTMTLFGTYADSSYFTQHTNLDGANNGLRESGDDNDMSNLYRYDAYLTNEGWNTYSFVGLDINNKFTRVIDGSAGACGTVPFYPSKGIYWTDSGRSSNTTYTPWNGNRWSVRVSANIPPAVAKAYDLSTVVANESVYIKCSRTTTHGAYLPLGLTKTLPATFDGFYYVFLGKIYQADSNVNSTKYVTIEQNHPIYYYSNIRKAICSLSEQPSDVVTSTTITTGTGLASSNSSKQVGDVVTQIGVASGYSIPTTAQINTFTNKYDKPSGGIPKTDLASSVQGSLKKADLNTTEIENAIPLVAGDNISILPSSDGLVISAQGGDLSNYVPVTRTINNKALSSDITLTAADVGVDENNFKGINKTGTVTSISVKMNGSVKGTITDSGTIDLGNVQSAGNYVSYTSNSNVSVAGNTETVATTNPQTLYVPNGLIMGGSAAAAGLVTRGICGVTTPGSTGDCAKENLYLNYDGSNTYNDSRQIILQAGTTGNKISDHLYEFAAVRGDALKTYITNTLKNYLTSVSLASGTNNGTLKLTVNGTATDNIAVKGLSTAAYKTATTTVGSDDTTLPTSKAVRTYVVNQGYLTNSSLYEANLKWGGKNFSGSYGPIDAAMVGELGANRFAFIPAANWTIEYSRDGGTTWTDYGATDSQKLALTSVGTGLNIGKADSSNKATAQYLLRLTLLTTGAVYSALNKFIIYLSTNGSNGCYCTIQGRTKTNVDAGNDTWTTFVDKQGVSGWSGWNVINTTSITTHGNSSGQYANLRFIFGCTSGSDKYNGLQISKLFAFGGVGWSTPSRMAASGHLYNYDSAQNATFPAGLTTTGALTANGAISANSTLTVKSTLTANGALTVAGVSNLQGKINIGQGDANCINLGSDGRINSGSATMLGFLNGTYTIGHTSYNTNIRGKATRLTYNSNNLALLSDVITDYTKLSNKPTINNSTISIKMNGGSKGSFTTNQASDSTIDLGDVITSHQDLSNYLTKDGGSLNSGKTLTFKDSSGVQGFTISNSALSATNISYGLDGVTYCGHKWTMATSPVSSGNVNLAYSVTGSANVDNKQDKLTAGSHISINSNTIAATWPSASDNGYAGINNTGTVTSVAVKMNNTTKGTVTTSGTIDLGTVLTDSSQFATKDQGSAADAAKEDISNAIPLVAGDNITILPSSDGLIISAAASSADLSNYVTTSALTTKLSDYVTSTSLTSQLSGYLKTSAAYVTSVKIGNTSYSPSNHVISLPSYPLDVITQYQGNTYGDCYNIAAPDSSYSIQIGESGFTVDQYDPDETEDVQNLFQVDTNGVYYKNSKLLTASTIATTSALGMVKSSTTSTDGVDRNVQVNSDGTMKVNVPPNYYPIRSYTSGLMISSGSGSSNCSLYVPYSCSTASSSGILENVGYSSSKTSPISVTTIRGYGTGTYLIVPCRATFGMYMYNSSGSEIGTYGAANGCNPLCIQITSTSQTSCTVYVNSGSFSVASFAGVKVYKIASQAYSI